MCQECLDILTRKFKQSDQTVTAVNSARTPGFVYVYFKDGQQAKVHEDTDLRSIREFVKKRDGSKLHGGPDF